MDWVAPEERIQSWLFGSDTCSGCASYLGGRQDGPPWVVEVSVRNDWLSEALAEVADSRHSTADTRHSAFDSRHSTADIRTLTSSV